MIICNWWCLCNPSILFITILTFRWFFLKKRNLCFKENITYDYHLRNIIFFFINFRHKVGVFFTILTSVWESATELILDVFAYIFSFKKVGKKPVQMFRNYKEILFSMWESKNTTFEWLRLTQWIFFYLKNCLLISAHNVLFNWPQQPFSKDFDLASTTTHYMCLNI